MPSSRGGRSDLEPNNNSSLLDRFPDFAGLADVPVVETAPVEEPSACARKVAQRSRRPPDDHCLLKVIR